MESKKGVDRLVFPLKEKYIAMIAPSFVVEFSYPSIITRLKSLGFDKVVELTFGAKMINREYHKQLSKTKKLIISSTCPGVVKTIKECTPKYSKNLIRVDSPMIATAKICKKFFPEHKTVFLSPCHFKKIEAEESSYIDYVIDYKELKQLFLKYKIPRSRKKAMFDKFYNDYTKIYPVTGGLSKTAHIKGVIKESESKNISCMKEILEFLKNPDPNIKFLDALFCKGGCIGGPCIASKLTLKQRKAKIISYLKKSKQEDIPEDRKGLIKKAQGIKFTY